MDRETPVVQVTQLARLFPLTNAMHWGVREGESTSNLLVIGRGFFFTTEERKRISGRKTLKMAVWAESRTSVLNLSKTQSKRFCAQFLFYCPFALFHHLS